MWTKTQILLCLSFSLTVIRYFVDDVDNDKSAARLSQYISIEQKEIAINMTNI